MNPTPQQIEEKLKQIEEFEKTWGEDHGQPGLYS